MNYLSKYLHLILLLTSSLFIFNCASKGSPDLTPEPSRKTMTNMPEWFLNTPVKEGIIYVSSTSTSQDMQLAINKATLDASTRLAGQVESEMNGYVERAQEEIGMGDNSDIIDSFNQTQSQVISSSLKSWKVSKKELQEERTNTGYIYKAYVLIEWDEGSAQKRLLAKIKADEKLFNAMRATELFDEMEEKVEAYRNRNK